MTFNPIPESTPASRAGGSVIVVDDEPHVLAVACAMLQSQGFQVVPCASGEEALEILQQSLQAGMDHQAMVLDLTLPGGMSGFEVMERLAATVPGLPVIASSGYFQEDARDLCQAIGFADILQKPYPVEHLCATVRRCIARERAPAHP